MLVNFRALFLFSIVQCSVWCKTADFLFVFSMVHVTVD